MTIEYFASVEANIVGNGNLWESQVQAYLAIKDHFDQGNRTPVITVLPTGTGKTGLMGIAPLGIATKRVLIVAPGLVIKKGILKSLNPALFDNFWIQRRVLTLRNQLPCLIEYTSEVRPEHLEDANFVVTNIQMTQSRNPNALVNKVPRDFFDMILIDEAHHSAANTWRDLEEYFAEAKIVKVTGTPFRSDGDDIYGEVKFNYPLGRAMLNGYVKRLIKETYIGEDLTFEITDEDGTVRIVPYDLIKEMKEADWIARQVAFSPSCSRTVVKESLAELRKKREATKKAHKIIAVASNIRHAQAISALYAEEGARVVVVDSKQDEDVVDESLTDFVNDRYDVIVHVSMLGEGFDHPLISIGAIFRPFKTLLPYAQFAGRTLRAIKGGNDIDNTAHLVHHHALGLDALWEYYRKEQEHATILERFKEIAGTMEAEIGNPLHGAEPRVVEPEDRANVEDAGTIESLALSFLDEFDIVKAYQGAMADVQRKTQAIVDTLKAQGVEVTPELLDVIQAANEGDYLRTKRPDLDYKERRRRLTQTIKDGVADILAKAGIDPKRPPTEYMGPAYRQYQWLLKRTTSIDGFLVAMINDQLRIFIGRTRDEWTTEDLIRGQDKVAELLDGVKAIVR